MIAAVVFDLDGTLVCLPVDWEGLFAEFRRIMGVDAVRPLVNTVSRLDKQLLLKVFTAWDKAEVAVFDGATACGEGMGVYREFEGKVKALVTLQGKAVVELLVKKFGFSFDVVVTREDSLFRAEQLLLATKKLKVPVQSILFVGNADSDSAAAEKLGCQFRRVK